MRFISTKNNTKPQKVSDAIRNGLADDGGLFIPENIPLIDFTEFNSNLSFVEFSTKLLTYFFDDDKLINNLESICEDAFNFPLPLAPLDNNTFILELYHGPTFSFKDFGARFLANCLNTLSTNKKTTLLVATSGDTGSAIACAFHLQANLNTIILYPKGKITKRQEQQIAGWGKQVLALAVEGNFDDCQQLVKSAFQNKSFSSHLSTGNSINIGRLLPQMTYYAYWSTKFHDKYKLKPGFIVPSGNLGNVTAAFWAKTMGFPIREIVIATNANTVVTDYLATGEFTPRRSIKTLANAMDIGNPSNFERLKHLYLSFSDFKSNINAYNVTDSQIKTSIQTIFRKYDRIVCPHTATACFVRQKLNDEPWIIVATADPCKFNDIIQPLIGQTVPIAPSFQSILERPIRTHIIEAKLDEIINFSRQYFN